MRKIVGVLLIAILCIFSISACNKPEAVVNDNPEVVTGEERLEEAK